MHTCQDKRASPKDSSLQASYGIDTIVGEFTAVYEDQLVIINDTDTWIGLLGLAFRSSDHTDFSTFSMMEQAYINNTPGTL